jgi:hypothetical protein
MSSKINEESVRKLVRAMLEGTVEVPIQANPNVEPLMNDRQLDYIERTPVDSVELSNVIGNKLRGLDDEVAPHIFRQLAAIIDVEEDKEKEEDAMTHESKLRSVIRRMLKETLDEAKPDPWKNAPPVTGPLPAVKKIPAGVHGAEYNKKFGKYKSDLKKMVKSTGAEDMGDEPERDKRGYMSTQAAGGASFDEIAAEFGFAGPQGAKAAVEKALAKMRYLMKLPEEDRDFLVLAAMDDYINMLSKTGELTPQDVTLLRAHPAIVQDLEGFKDHLHKFVLRGMRDAKADEGGDKE